MRFYVFDYSKLLCKRPLSALAERSRHLALQVTAVLCASIASSISFAAEDLTNLDLSTLMQMDVTIVSAQKRSEDASKVPIFMNVITADQVEGSNVIGTNDLQLVSPGLTTSGSGGYLLPYIRGVGTDVNSAGIESSIAVYVDGVYQLERTQTFFDLYDVQQIEVLKGPQGTLYGRNATGGAINITTKGPTKQPTGSLQISSGNFNLIDSSALFAGPLLADSLGDKLCASLSGHVRKMDGYYKNLFDGADVNSEDFYSLHGRVQFDITSSLRGEVMLKYFYRDDSSAFGSQTRDDSIPELLGIPVARRAYETNSNLTDSGNRIESRTAAAKIDWDTSSLHLQSVTSQDTVKHVLSIDLDSSAATLVHLKTNEASRTFMQEFQLSPTRESKRLYWLAGAFYIENSNKAAPVTYNTAVPFIGVVTRIIESGLDTKAFATFGEATLSLTDSFSMTGGLRYSNEEKRLLDSSTIVVGNSSTFFPGQSHQWHDTNYRLIAKYTTKQSMLYAKTETAFKSGAYSSTNLVDPGPIDPEQIATYEVGFKSDLAHLPIRVAVATFYNDYRDLQIQVVDQATNGTRLVQAAKAETYGIDTNLNFKVSEHWNLATSVSWLQAQYREFVSSGILIPSPSGGNISSPELDLAGNYLSRSPQLTANATVSFKYPLAGGELTGSTNIYHSSRVYFDPANAYSQGAFSIVNANIGYRWKDGSKAGWEVSGWSRNLTDEAYYNTIVPTQLGATNQYGQPRMFGLTLRYSFAN